MQKIEEVLKEYRDGKVDLESVLEFLRKLPFEDLSFARIDHHRSLRRGFPEVVFGEGKTADQIAEIIGAMEAFGSTVLVTRVEKDKAEEVIARVPRMEHHPTARMLSLKQEASMVKAGGIVHILCAGSSDMPVAEEAAVTAEFMGSRVRRFFDVGVAGLHRLLHLWDELRKASAYVVVAGMEGALPSVVAGMVERPVIAVPTSIGYGSSFGGLAALLGMLNTCSPGVAVVNIDNGFGAGYMASLIARAFAGKPISQESGE